MLIIVIIVCTCILYSQNKDIQRKQDLILWNTNMIYENRANYDDITNVYENLKFQIDVLQATIEGYWGHILSIEESTK